MKKLIIISFLIVLLSVGCATGGKTVNKSLAQMQENLERTQTELIQAKQEVSDLHVVMKDIDAISNNMNDLLSKLKSSDATARNYFNDIIVPYMRNQQALINDLQAKSEVPSETERRP